MSAQPRKFKTPITVRHKCHAFPVTHDKNRKWFITLIPNVLGNDAHIEVRSAYSKTTRRITLDALIKQLTVPGAVPESAEGGK